MTRIVIILAFVTVLAGGAYWHFNNRAIQAAYVDAVALCKTSKAAGSAKIKALDKLHGENSRPDSLKLSISSCNLSSALDDYENAKRRLDALQ